MTTAIHLGGSEPKHVVADLSWFAVEFRAVGDQFRHDMMLFPRHSLSGATLPSRCRSIHDTAKMSLLLIEMSNSEMPTTVILLDPVSFQMLKPICGIPDQELNPGSPVMLRKSLPDT